MCYLVGIPMLQRYLFRTGLAALFLALAPAAAAHGDFPRPRQVALDPANTERIVVRATYGLLVSEDDGDQWRWVCPEAVGFDGTLEDPAMLLTANGTLALGTFGGLSIGTSNACGWATVPGDPDGRYFVDVRSRPGNLSEVIGLSSNGKGDSVFEVFLWRSGDDLASLDKLGVPPPSDFLALSLGLPSAGSDKLYLAGRHASGGSEGEFEYGVLYRSTDAGQSWEHIEVPGTSEGAVPYIRAVHPGDEDMLFASNVLEEQSVVVASNLMVSVDGGDTWETVFSANEDLPAFALSPDGTQIAVGGVETGLRIADVGSYAFEQVASIECDCVTWTEQGIYVCASDARDGFAVGVSHDGGASFDGIMRLSSPCGALECSEGDLVHTECEARWPTEQMELNAFTCSPDPEPAPPPAPDPNGSCGCKLVGSDPSTGLSADRYFIGSRGGWPAPWWVALAGLTALGLCRRWGSAGAGALQALERLMRWRG